MTLTERRAQVAKTLHDPVMLDEAIADLVAQISRPCCPRVRQALWAELEYYVAMQNENTQMMKARG